MAVFFGYLHARQLLILADFYKYINKFSKRTKYILQPSPHQLLSLCSIINNTCKKKSLENTFFQSPESRQWQVLYFRYIYTDFFCFWQEEQFKEKTLKRDRKRNKQLKEEGVKSKMKEREHAHHGKGKNN